MLRDELDKYARLAIHHHMLDDADDKEISLGYLPRSFGSVRHFKFVTGTYRNVTCELGLDESSRVLNWTFPEAMDV